MMLIVRIQLKQRKIKIRYNNSTMKDLEIDRLHLKNKIYFTIN